MSKEDVPAMPAGSTPVPADSLLQMKQQSFKAVIAPVISTLYAQLHSQDFEKSNCQKNSRP